MAHPAARRRQSPWSGKATTPLASAASAATPRPPEHPPSPVGPTLFYTRLSPTVAMGPDGRIAAIALCALPCLAFGVLAAVVGFWLVAPIFVLEIGLVAGVVWIVGRRRRAFEEITVQTDGVVIRRFDGRQHLPLQQMPVAWTRLERDVDPDYGCRALLLKHRRQCAVVAAQLAPAQRQALGDALEEALRRARLGGLASQHAVADRASPWTCPS